MLYFLYFCIYFVCLFYFQSSRATFVTVGAWSINWDGSSTFSEALLTPVRAAVRSQARSSDILRTDCFSSTQNLYTIWTIFRASSLYIIQQEFWSSFKVLKATNYAIIKNHTYFVKKATLISWKLKKNVSSTGLERLISDSLVTKKLWLLKALSHNDVYHQRMPTYEKLSKYVGVRWIR